MKSLMKGIKARSKPETTSASFLAKYEDSLIFLDIISAAKRKSESVTIFS